MLFSQNMCTGFTNFHTEMLNSLVLYFESFHTVNRQAGKRVLHIGGQIQFFLIIWKSVTDYYLQQPQPTGKKAQTK